MDVEMVTAVIGGCGYTAVSLAYARIGYRKTRAVVIDEVADKLAVLNKQRADGFYGNLNTYHGDCCSVRFNNDPVDHFNLVHRDNHMFAAFFTGFIWPVMMFGQMCARAINLLFEGGTPRLSEYEKSIVITKHERRIAELEAELNVSGEQG